MNKNNEKWYIVEANPLDNRKFIKKLIAKFNYFQSW